jgi:MoaA/NifB/PqqE/SkfB family radical SAM enzyme
LLRTDIADLIERVKRNKMICHVSTNASLIPEKIHALKDIDALDISLDGMRENNDKNRGQGTFEITLEGIRCALKNGLTTNVNMVLTRHNVSDVDDVVKLAQDLGFSLSFNLAFESHSVSHINYRDSLAIKNEDDAVLKNTLKKIIAYKKKNYPIRFSAAAYTYALQWPVSYGGKVYITSREQLGAFKPLKCFFSRFHCYIDADGRMYNCMHLKDTIPEVNIREEPLGEAWKKVCAFKNECITCYTICNNDANLIFGLKPGVIFSTVRDCITKR